MARSLCKTKVWGRGYTTVPVIVRKLLDLKSGDGIEWRIDDSGRIYVTRCKGSNG